MESDREPSLKYAKNEWYKELQNYNVTLSEWSPVPQLARYWRLNFEKGALCWLTSLYYTTTSEVWLYIQHITVSFEGISFEINSFCSIEWWDQHLDL